MSLILRLITRTRFYCTGSGKSTKPANVSKQYPSPTLVNASNSSKTGPSPNSLKDIIIFRYDNQRQFKLLNFFAITQFGFWMFISYTSLSLVNVPIGSPVSEKEGTKAPISSDDTSKKALDDLPFYRKVNLGEDKYKYGLCIATFLMGYGILFASWFYIVRSVRFLVLRKDRKTVSFVTYSPLGGNRIMDVPLNCISAEGSRLSKGSQLPLKVKNKSLYYVLELKGDFPHPKLFDQTVGIQRNLL